MALTAIDSYRLIPVRKHFLPNDWKNCFERALTMTQMLGKPATDKLDDIKRLLLDTLSTVTKPESWLACSLSELLKNGRLAKEQAEWSSPRPTE